MRTLLPIFATLTGCVLIATGLFLLAPWLGITATGMMCVGGAYVYQYLTAKAAAMRTDELERRRAAA